jgi:hypothetical protein
LLLAILAARELALSDSAFSEPPLVFVMLVGGIAAVIAASTLGRRRDRRDEFVPPARSAMSGDVIARTEISDGKRRGFAVRWATVPATEKPAFAGRKRMAAHCALNVQDIRPRSRFEDDVGFQR